MPPPPPPPPTMPPPLPTAESGHVDHPPPCSDQMDIDLPKPHSVSRHASPGSDSHSRSSSSRRESFGSIEEESTGIAQSFVDKENSPLKERANSAKTALNVQSPTQTPDFCCPCGGFLGWKQIRLGGRRASRSYSDLRILGGGQQRGWAWETVQTKPVEPTVKEEELSPKEREPAPIEKLPAELLDQIISNLAVDIPPNGYTPRNVDLVSCLLASRTLHSATLSVLYRNITVPHSIIFSKALNHIRQYPSLGTIVRRLDFSHFTSIGLGRTQQMNLEIQNLTARTLLECLNLLPNLKELLLQEHVEDDLDGGVTRKIFSDIPNLRAVDFCGCSSNTFSTGFVSAVTENPQLPMQLRTLRRISLHECTGLPDIAFQALLPKLTNLTHLDVAHTQITNQTLFMISPNAEITHLNLSRCTRLTGPEVVNFLTTHPAVTHSLVYLNLMSDASRHRILEVEDVDALLPYLTSTLRSLNLGGSRITSEQMPMLLKLSKHLEELGLNSANITIDDINSFFRPPPAGENQMEVEWARPQLRYIDLTKNPYLTQATLLNPKSCLLVTPQSYPLQVIELTERIITPLRQRSPRNGWVIRDLGRRGWYVREPPTDPKELILMPRDDGWRAWKMGARWWGMRKIPVCIGDVGGIYGHYMFKK